MMIISTSKLIIEKKKNKKEIILIEEVLKSSIAGISRNFEIKKTFLTIVSKNIMLVPTIKIKTNLTK